MLTVWKSMRFYYCLVTIKQISNIKEIKNIAQKNKLTLEF
ncbi:hypothetical protein Javan197_0045 [Streptococcus phage Javan197]|nr:hypothetical protein Javan197_0045 [Streptococcus phage Javan197]